jgi:type I restriction enzyme S subunit
LAEICELNPPKPSADFLPPEAEVTFAPMPAVDAYSGTLAAPQIRPFIKVRNGHPSFRDGDLIMAKITPCMENGKAAVVRGLRNGIGFGSTEFHVMRPTPAVLSEYLYYFIRQKVFRKAAEGEMTGSVGQKRVPADFLKRVAIPLPPKVEQKRIVAKVEALLARVNAAREQLSRVSAILKRFRQSVLAAACSGSLTADWREKNLFLAQNGGSDQQSEPPKEWSTKRLHELVQTLEQGWSPKCELDPSPSVDKWGVIKTTAVQALEFLEQENKRLPDDLAPRPALELKAGDLLITRAGPRVRAGVSCLVQSVRPQLIVCDKVYRFRVDEKVVLPKFVALALNTPAMLELIDTLKTGISDSGVNLTQEKFLDLELCLPPLTEQHEIVRRVEVLFRLADAIQNRVVAATARAEKLTQAILGKAFRGELVPTEAEFARREGRSYEGASVLLDRIRAEREGTAATAPKSKRRRTSKPDRI